MGFQGLGWGFRAVSVSGVGETSAVGAWGFGLRVLGSPSPPPAGTPNMPKRKADGIQTPNPKPYTRRTPTLACCRPRALRLDKRLHKALGTRCTPLTAPLGVTRKGSAGVPSRLLRGLLQGLYNAYYEGAISDRIYFRSEVLI